jgi:mRNA-degrading endonuclease RelE of RelBE toxin-antitoxin system
MAEARLRGRSTNWLREVPELKRPTKSSLQALGENPALGEPRLRELEGLWKYRVRRFRIVCR